MDISLIAGKLLRLGLIGADGEGLSVSLVGPLLFLTDGSNSFYTDPKNAWEGLRELDTCSSSEFWDREWLSFRAPVYSSLAEVWDSLDTPLLDAADKSSQSSEDDSIGRLRRFGGRDYLLQTENGEYGVVGESQAGKWMLTQEEEKHPRRPPAPAP